MSMIDFAHPQVMVVIMSDESAGRSTESNVRGRDDLGTRWMNQWAEERDQRPPTLAHLNLTYILTGYYKSGAEVTRLEDAPTDAGIWSGKGGESYLR